MPRHIAIIMDGNGRWARNRQLPRLEGHRRGSEVVEGIAETCRDLGIENLTLYAFSQENWSRPTDEVAGLMELLKYFLVEKRPKLIKNEIRLRVIGQIDRLPESVLRELTKTIYETRHCEKMTLTLALSYSSRSELTEVVNLMVRSALAEGNASRVVREDELDRMLYTEGLPEPDLLIRTSGEHRISNFLLWQMAYTELYFTETLWPDFGRAELEKAIEEYQRRERRFGLTTDQVRAIL
ncbi:MAG: isoprenyl transferase [Deltaproteobacteria bacterium]|nr:isoprenyl transferase [Deltaproteobacteria bacterium]